MDIELDWETSESDHEESPSVEEVPNSQNPQNPDLEYNPVPSQSQPGPSTQDSLLLDIELDWETCSSASESDHEESPSVEEVPNSQNPDLEYNPVPSQSQPGPSTQDSLPGPSNHKSNSAPPKRRGRPTKKSTSNIRPVRGSQRKTKRPKPLNYEKFYESGCEWSEKDTTLLLTGCMKYGVEDIAGLKSCLPHKTDKDIRNQITMWKVRAQKKLRERLAANEDVGGAKAETIKNLDEWIKYFQEKAKTSSADGSAFVLAYYFEIMAEYGVFPDPKECGGIDMRAIYRAIHCMMNGLPIYGLTRVNAVALRKTLDNVLEKLDDPERIGRMQDLLLDHATSQPDPKKFGRTYSKKEKNTSTKDIDQILSNPIMNPLNLPLSALMRMEDDEDSDED